MKIPNILIAPRLVRFLCGMYLLCGLLAFLIGFHNIDLAYNKLWLTEHYNLSYDEMYDMSMGGFVVHNDEMYRNGMIMMYIGATILTISALVLGLYLHKGDNYGAKT